MECPRIVPAEYHAVSALKVPELEQSQHPISGNYRRFVSRDRFQSATNLISSSLISMSMSL